MKVPFKKVGDNFSQEEYNAICYLLQKQNYQENIILDFKAWHGTYGAYVLQDPFECFIRTHDGYTINQYDKHISLVFDTQCVSADVYVTFNVLKQRKVKVDGIDVILYPDDMLDDENNYDKDMDLEWEEIRVKAKPFNDKFVIDLYPSQMGLNDGDFVSFVALCELDYGKPLINVKDGLGAEGAIICNSFVELRNAIVTSDVGSTVIVKLKGDRTYTFTEELTVDGNKTVIIYGGNTNHNAVLDGQDQYRLFSVKNNSTLELHNLTLYRGNGSKVNKTSDLHKTAGAIYMISQYGNTGEEWILEAPTVICDECTFKDCHANMGGAIYNLRGKLICTDCTFDNCDATAPENPEGAFGGAITNQSVKLYNDHTNQIYIDPSPVIYRPSARKTDIYLNISHGQNLLFFKSNDFVLPPMKCYVGNTLFNVTLQKNSQWEYGFSLPVQLRAGMTMYLFAENFPSLPNLCTRVLTVYEENNNLYLRVVDD